MDRTDEQLACLAKQGDSDAMDEILERYKNYVKIRARSFFLAGSEMEDLIQEGMIGLYKAVRDYSTDKGTAFKSFAYLCISRQLFTAIKEANREKHRALNTYVSLSAPLAGNSEKDKILFETADETPESNPEDVIIGKELMDSLKADVERILSPQENKILVMYLNGLSYMEISDRMKVNRKCIDNTLQKIKKKLSKCAQNYDLT